MDGSSGVAAFGEPVEALAKTVAASPAQLSRPQTGLVIGRLRPGQRARLARWRSSPLTALLSAVLESVTGAPVREALVARVLTPFQLSMTYPAGDEVPPPGSDPDPSRHTYDGGPPSIESAGEISKGLWDPTGSGTLRELTDLPPHVLAVLGPARGMASGAADMARTHDTWRTDLAYLSPGSRDMLTRSFEDGGFGGVAMCPCQGSRRLAVGLLGRVGPYLSLVVYLPADRLTIAIAMNIDVGDDNIEAYAQDVFDLVTPAFR